MIERKLVKLDKIPTNKVTRFCLPAINLLSPSLDNMKVDSIKRKGYEVLNYFGLVNCYLYDIDVGKEDYILVLLFNPDRTALRKWSLFYDYYKGIYNYRGSRDIDLGVVSLTFSVIARNRPVIDAFLLGKYSKFPPAYVNENFTIFDGIRSYWAKERKICSKSSSYREELAERIGVDYIPAHWELEEPWDMRDVLDYQAIKSKIKEKI